SFVVTLAGLLAWSGVVLILTTQYSQAGTIVIQDPVVKGVANAFLPAAWGWVVYAVVVIGFAGTEFYQRATKARQNLAVKPLGISLFQIIGLAVVAGAAVWYANTDRGVPVSIMIALAFLFFWLFIANRTRFGRYVYAVGGNPEAARRAGINVNFIRISCFMISSFMASIGGIILASRLGSVSTNTGGGNLLLNAIAAAVVGGTSLFGGTGRVTSALLGALVIASVENGMGLMGWNSGVKFVVNGLVLLAAVLVDAYSRRSRASSGIA
ncbi:MAG: ABC transporter permease, partial [Chloroflexota bacterium]